MTDRDGLVAFFRETAGDDLRSLIQYEGEDLDLEYDRQYVREDIRDAGEPDLDTVVRQFRLSATAEDRRTDLLDVGPHHVTLRLYDDAVLIHFPQGEAVGTILSLDVSVFPSVTTFIGECVEYLNRQTPQRIESLPSWTTG